MEGAPPLLARAGSLSILLLPLVLCGCEDGAAPASVSAVVGLLAPETSHPHLIPSSTDSRSQVDHAVALRIAFLALLLQGLPHPVGAQSQETLAHLLRHGDAAVRGEAVQRVSRMDPESVGPDLRSALRENLRWWVALPRPFANEGLGEGFLQAADAVVRLRDPASIPELLLVVGTGNAVTDALAEMKASAFPQLLALVGDPGAPSDRVAGGVRALTKMTTGQRGEPLTPEERRQVADVCLELLRPGQHYAVLLPLPRLMVALEDERLRERLDRILSDPAEAERLGVPPEMSDDYRDRVRRELGSG